MKNISLLLISITLLSSFPKTSLSASTLVRSQSLIDGRTLVSEGQRFELGFFTPSTSSLNRYLGIWYKDISPQTVVWVANRNTPLNDSSGVLKLDKNGNLLLLNRGRSVIWSSNQTKLGNPMAEQPTAKLLYSGNLVVTKGNGGEEESYFWQSFDHATDTQLQGMKLGWDSKTGANNTLISWRSDDDPSTGNFSSVIGPSGAPEMFLLHDQTRIYRLLSSGGPQMRTVDRFIPNFILSRNQKYFWFTVNESVVSRVVLDKFGKLQRLVWLDGAQGWTPIWVAQEDHCDDYNRCGPNAVCMAKDIQSCTCVKGFEPRNKTLWDYRASGGCVRNREFQCGRDDGFFRLKGIKLPDCSQAYFNQSMDFKECEEMCRRNCSCTAYAATGSGACINWMGDLVDLREYSTRHQDIYVRLAASELGSNNKGISIIVTAVVISMAFLLGLTIYLMWKKKTLKRKTVREGHIPESNEVPPSEMSLLDENKKDDLDLPVINFHIIAAATENFSDVNKLGEGGFGFVYKGTLADGQQIAVKRLSKNSGQGVDEFKNEVNLIAKLQHRNLVKLLGCCICGEEKMLIYEYMPNKSLDFFLFDKTKSLLLDWKKRFNIIVGIARGLLYLHQDSRLRIIHRDLKASNILLDDEMNPKISDFGMARIFGNNQTEANTMRVVGTYGYMSPEYAMDGIFSVKSDVFSYGVLVLEIITGKKNKGFYSSSSELNLLGHAWRSWNEGKGLELTDESISHTCSTEEVLKCIHVGLLCVQEHAEDRPTSSSVISMLDSEHAILSEPQQPGFSLGKTPKVAYSSSNDQETCSVNNITVTMLEAR